MSAPPLIEVNSVTKRFGGVASLSDVSLSIDAGTVHSLVGENGAGKSTLGKLISGVLMPDEGEIRLDGHLVSLRSPREALGLGIVTIAQELAIVPGLSAAENVFLGAEPRWVWAVKRRELRQKYLELAERLHFNIPPDVAAGSLSIAGQQQVEIMRALARQARLVIMDEPTAALSGAEVEALHEIIRSLAREGKSVLLISHFLSEVLELSDAITTLRDGRLVRTVAAADATESSLIEGMLGRTLDAAFPAKSSSSRADDVVLSVSDLVAPKVEGVSFELHAGEILGIAGLVGAGRSELARAIFQDVRRRGGEVHLGGQSLVGRSPTTSIERGMVMIPESRKEMGLFVGRSLKENVSISSLRHLSRFGWISARRERQVVGDSMARVAVKAASALMPASGLSGGNQQKLLFARTLLCSPKVLIADEPTRGVDVGSKRAIYDLLVEMAAGGMGIVVISSELEEVIGLAHRVLVMKGGRIVRELEGEQMNHMAILEAAFAGTLMEKETK
jgi:simple sugar transport system ATP-binding protein/ribose transport system ATP-binding protein